MKFFPPELYVRVVSSDDEVADAASEEWERAGTRYLKHIKKIWPQLPESLRKFESEVFLHDAEVFGPARLSMQTIPWSDHDVLIVTHNINTLLPEQNRTMTVLQYAVTENPVIQIPVWSDNAFHKGNVIWLHDEIDVVAPGIFSHEIQLSDGRVVSLKFREFRYHFAPLILPVNQGQTETPVPAPAEGKPSRRPRKAASA
jgi:hypothetical protein